MAKDSLTLEEINQTFSYDPENGFLFWKRDHGKKIKAGTRAGSFSGDGYIDVQFMGRNYRAHRIIWILMTGKIPTIIDHINRVRHDNKWSNLREVTSQQNARNSSVRINSTTGVKGVSRSVLYRARIKYNGKIVGLGYFKTIEEAKAAYQAAELKYYGEISVA